jgi:predicted transposase/invertase (TIGR01784 family)
VTDTFCKLSLEEAVTDAVKYCVGHNILKKYLEERGAEMFDIFAEYNQEEAMAVRYEEGHEDGREEAQLEIARNALAEGASFEFVQKITGLDMETIKSL